ncbi:MAG: S1-like domain-containing RNA-binding protein [Clostridium sp.]|nr:S1-like domain-containing RNA-binding protein [Clostridium sp.]
MIEIGKFNKLKVARKAPFGYFLDANTGNTDDDILLPNNNTMEQEITVGDTIDAFLYKDSKDRPVATLKTPYTQAYELAYLKVVSVTPIGAFADMGLDRDLFIPLKEQNYKLIPDQKYLLRTYVDKTERLAASTFIDEYLDNTEEDMTGKDVEGIAYGFQTNDSVMIAVDKKYKGVILNNQYFTKIHLGQELKLRVIKQFEDGKMSLTPRKAPKNERLELEEVVLNYLKEHDGFMPFNDKSSPSDIKETFHESKNYFKNALGGLMKRELIEQNAEGTKLKSK